MSVTTFPVSSPCTQVSYARNSVRVLLCSDACRYNPVQTCVYTHTHTYKYTGGYYLSLIYKRWIILLSASCFSLLIAPRTTSSLCSFILFSGCIHSVFTIIYSVILLADGHPPCSVCVRAHTRHSNNAAINIFALTFLPNGAFISVG